ncbi:gasdermin-C [Lynx canadensis]|uniref:gasdermin-C n=1 Tax=Lynx canadensis TaxID=61383 RepID=UPI0011B05DE5|nr:gasdermin-C [Lynx canadensis]
MSSMFENISKNLVKELGDKDLTPVKHLLDANKFRQFAILRKKKKTLSQFWELPDIPVEYTLMDILEPSSSVPETVIKGPFIFSDTMFRKYKASAGVTAMLETNVSGEATKCHETFLQFHAVTFPPQNWNDLLKRKVLDQELLFLRKCRGRDDNLYVVTEAVELINSTVLHDSSSVNVLGKCFIPWMTSVKGQGQGEGLKVREKMLTLPEGTVIAYKKKQLIFENNDILISDDDTQKTFPEERMLRKVKTSNFKQLHEEIFQEMEALAQLSKDTQDSIFHTILNMLGNREALQNLTDTLDGSPLDLLDDFGGTILNEMQPDTRDLWIQARFHIIYLLEAIMVLSDTQHDLLAQSMEKRILLQQQKLVRSILEPNFKYCWDIPFTLKPELLAPLQGEDLAITYGLLEECGLKMELNSPRSTWDLETKQPLSALYGTLSLLKQLAENSCMGLSLEAWTACHCPWYSQPGPQIQGQSHMVKEKTETIPQGTISAYRVLQLVIKENCWAILYLPEGKLGQSFPVCGELLTAPQALQELKDMLEKALDTGVLGQLGGPGGFILSTLWNPSGRLLALKGRAILCILGALLGLQMPADPAV